MIFIKIFDQLLKIFSICQQSQAILFHYMAKIATAISGL